MTFLVSFLLAGLALQLAARFWPVRAFAESEEALLDGFALVFALVCQLAIAYAAYPLIQSVQNLEAVSASYALLLALPPVAAGLFYFVTVDFLAYWMHRLNHSRHLWSTHAFHHSSRNLYWASGMRGSPVHFALLGAPSLLILVVFSPVGAVASMAWLYGVAHNSIIHSNVRVPTRLLNWVFVTGESHLVHHLRDPKYGNSNFGFLFTFWDRIFGTWVDPRSVPSDLPLGLDYEVSTARLLIGLPAKKNPAKRDPAMQNPS